MKCKLIFSVLTAALFLQACAVRKNPAMYGSSITKEDAYKHISILASDEFAGRETGEPGAEKAAQYIKKYFQSLGLRGPVNGDYFQKVDLKEKSLTGRNISVNGTPLEFLKDFVMADYTGPKTTFTNFVFVGYGINSDQYDDLSNTNLDGKVAIILPGEPMLNGKYLITGTDQPSKFSTSNTKSAAIRAKKPSLIITVNPNISSFASRRAAFDNPRLTMGDDMGGINSIAISPAVLNQLLSGTGKTLEEIQKAISQTGKPMPLTFNSSLNIDVQTNYKGIEAKNVLGYLEGSDPKLKNELLVITAHYDHVGVDASGDAFNGADDDASGTSAVLELAEAFVKAKRDGKGPRRSILFMPVVGEEKGLLGSEWYSLHPVFPLANTIADLNIDMIGRVGDEYKGKPDSANYVYVIGSDKLSSTMKEINEKANNDYTKITLDYKYDDPKDTNRFYYRSDHYNFAKHNIPIIFYFNGVHEDYHKVTDELKKINFDAWTKRAQLVFYTAWELANRDERPKVDKVNDFPEDR
ncbi:MAG TPA: M28 family peptidase [Sphingobacteriaceae bacterium]|nr:M28 family peptidase [Sphingobacteriaceae bacterium]